MGEGQAEEIVVGVGFGRRGVWCREEGFEERGLVRADDYHFPRLRLGGAGQEDPLHGPLVVVGAVGVAALAVLASTVWAKSRVTRRAAGRVGEVGGE